MSDLPKSVILVEEGPREGFQMETSHVATADKVRLVDCLSDTGLKHIEVTSFVNPRFIPQMADAEQVSEAFARKPGVHYSALTFTASGVRKVLSSGKYDDAGPLPIIASDAISLSNTNKTTQQAIVSVHGWLKAVRDAGFPLSAIVANVFGCNVEGDIPVTKVISIIEMLRSTSMEMGMKLETVGLADTVGSANPVQIKRVVSTVRDKFPGMELYLHLHDTRGTGMANLYAGLEAGISRFDCSIGGLGGCPYAGGAAGNVATEDVALMCEEMGIDTGLDIERLFACARVAEQIVGHVLPGKAKVGGRVKHCM